jgi:hypothetical protein
VLNDVRNINEILAPMLVGVDVNHILQFHFVYIFFMSLISV